MSYYDRDKSNAPTTMQWPKPHFGSVAEYQVSPWPFCEIIEKGVSDAEAHEINFKSVTRWICITALEGDVKVAFADPDAIDPETTIAYGWESYFIVPSGTTSPRIEVKCTKIWVEAVSGTFKTEITVMAGVTSIDTSQFPDISERTGVKHEV
jgi:hypothetical protein